MNFNRNKQMCIWVSEEERNQINERARELGFGVSAYLRGLAFLDIRTAKAEKEGEKNGKRFDFD